MNMDNNSMLRLKIQLRNVTKPPVWRRVLIPSDITFYELHYIIQTVTSLLSMVGKLFGGK